LVESLLQINLHFNRKESIMKRSYKVAAAVAAALGLGVAAAAFAHPGGMGGGMGPGMMMGGMQQLVTPEERSAFQEKMRNAKTPEERQEIAQAQRAEMQKRAQEKGITGFMGPNH
jgi:predicted phage tail protein